MMNMGQLDRKVSVITGAASGIGRATALAFAREGARVVVVDVLVNEGNETVRMIKKAGGEAFFVETDVTQESDAEALVSKAVATYGRLDCAVNNAGIEGETALTADCSKDNWDRTIAIDLTGVFLGMKYQIRQMLKQGGGATVNTASTQGLVANAGVPAYVAAKHGVIGLTKSTALAYVKENIRVNAICPGNVHTAILDRYKSWNPDGFQALLGMTPLGRLAEPGEIANAIVWLCSDAASYCTGHALVVDGCYTSQ
jgi:NAD(P)-dependent dehydrogenase (short-subunit alcohol dehydrogenase family)